MRSMEPRSFAPERRPVGELTPIDIEALSEKEWPRVLLNGIVQTHGCLEAHIFEQTKVNSAAHLYRLEATEKRQELAEDVLTLREDVHKISLALGVKKPEPGEEKPKSTGLATWGPMKVVGGLAAMGISVPVLIKVIDAVGPDLWAAIVKAAGVIGG